MGKGEKRKGIFCLGNPKTKLPSTSFLFFPLFIIGDVEAEKRRKKKEGGGGPPVRF